MVEVPLWGSGRVVAPQAQGPGRKSRSFPMLLADVTQVEDEAIWWRCLCGGAVG